MVKIVLVAALLRNKNWAYPLMIAFLLAFIVYQIYRMTFAPSIGLVLLTAFDTVVVWLHIGSSQSHNRTPGEGWRLVTATPL